MHEKVLSSFPTGQWRFQCMYKWKIDAIRVKIFRNNHSEMFCWKGVLKICSKFRGEHPCRSATSIKLQQLYWSRTSAWVFSCKFVAYFQNTFSTEHLWMAASEILFKKLNFKRSNISVETNMYRDSGFMRFRWFSFFQKWYNQRKVLKFPYQCFNIQHSSHSPLHKIWALT